MDKVNLVVIENIEGYLKVMWGLIISLVRAETLSFVILRNLCLNIEKVILKLWKKIGSDKKCYIHLRALSTFWKFAT